ncbi:hypothetical protein ACIA98_34080 [Streptomyces sp. NPDC051366]|uniref:hypothetical protein n=1 Tax=unclassified Streptomyces TaxID=2593676 RepID=UPI002E26C604|nr:hypothetical protein OG296_23665 [Streptomyces sp. NBC_01001]
MKMKRVGGVLAAVFVAAALPMVAASPASADQGDCQYSLHQAGYDVGPKIEAACKIGADPFNGAPYAGCYLSLINIGVRHEAADAACSSALT